MIKLIATGHTFSGANEYEVRNDNALLGWLYKEKYAGSGRQFAGCVGHYTGGYQWVFAPDNDDDPPEYFDTFKEAEARLAASGHSDESED